MGDARSRRIDTLFLSALELPARERGAWLAGVCGGDDALKGDVEALLAAHEIGGGILDGPSVASSSRDRAEERRIGPWRVIGELGRGGMGVVYLVERDDGHYRRLSALKLLRTGGDSDELKERFRAERQILASLAHPNIAQLLDGGVSDGHLPYLVMEYVEGLPITEYCDRHRLSVEERLRLFRDVCAAVHHAHRNLVIHRDLKPGNVLVTEQGQVKLLDFGIAKLLNPSLSAVPLPVTRTELRVMTPDYASPEQFRGDPLSTASDVYALGVLLYELLTGRRAFDLSGRSPSEAAMLVCEQEPERPSVAVTRPATSPGWPRTRGGAHATARGALPPAGLVPPLPAERLRRILRGDLDAIVMMALRKEPARRYGSADLLAADVQRYLEGLPVLAHRGSRRYRAAKLLRRHRVTASAAALVALSLLAGTGVASWQAAAAHRERVRAEAALAQAEELAAFLMGLFDSGESESEAAGMEITARDLLRRGVAQADALSDQPAVQARMLDVIGRMHHRLGYFGDAERLLRRAVALRREEPGGPSLALAESLVHLSWVHRSRTELEDARRLVGEAVEIRRAHLPADHPDLAEGVIELGRVSETEAQEVMYREALGMLQRAGAAPERQVGLLQSLSTNVRRQGRLEEAVATDREALRLAERYFGGEHHVTASAMIHLADHVRDVEEDMAQAEALFRRGLELLSRQFGESHLRLIHGLNSLGTLRSRLGDHAEAERLFRKAMAISVASIGPDHPDVAGHMVAIAGELERQGRLEEAEGLAREALERFERIFGPGHLASVRPTAGLASIRFGQGRLEEGDTLYRRAISTAQRLQSVVAAELEREYGLVLLDHGLHEAAEERLLSSLETLERVYGSGSHPNVVETKRALVELYGALGRPDLAERYRVPQGRFFAY